MYKFKCAVKITEKVRSLELGYILITNGDNNTKMIAWMIIISSRLLLQNYYCMALSWLFSSF